MFFAKFRLAAIKALSLALVGAALHAAPAAADVLSAGDQPQSTAYTQIVSHNGSFVDVFNFHLTTMADVVGAMASLSLDFGGSPLLRIEAPTLSMFSSAAPLSAIATGSTGLMATALPSGDYFIKVAGNANGAMGGTYAFGLSSLVSPVPEPGQWALLLAGLMGVGMVVRRRSRV